MISVVLASPLPVLREGMKRVLHNQRDIAVVAEVSGTHEVYADEKMLHANVLVIVAHPPSTSSVADLLHLKRRNPKLGVIVIMRSPSVPQVLAVLRSGVRGLLNSSCEADHLPNAIRAVSSGRLYMHEEVSKVVAAGIGQFRKDHTHHALSKRELDVFLRLASGSRISEIAAQLGISAKTVSTHKARMMEKMGLTSTSQIVQYAIVHDLSGATLE